MTFDLNPVLLIKLDKRYYWIITQTFDVKVIKGVNFKWEEGEIQEAHFLFIWTQRETLADLSCTYLNENLWAAPSPISVNSPETSFLLLSGNLSLSQFASPRSLIITSTVLEESGI